MAIEAKEEPNPETAVAAAFLACQHREDEVLGYMLGQFTAQFGPEMAAQHAELYLMTIKVREAG